MLTYVFIVDENKKFEKIYLLLYNASNINKMGNHAKLKKCIDKTDYSVS